LPGVPARQRFFGCFRYDSAVADPQTPPMGCLDAIDIGSKKLTIQTEFFSRPTWRIETKVYLAGAVKKVYTADLEGRPETELQRLVNDFHQTKMDEIVAGLRGLKS
jgi:hypothetical protein